MFATEYYCLVAGLKEYSLDADTKGFDAKAIVGEILDGVSASDAAQVRLLYGYYDCENIASLRAGRSAHNPLGNFTREELEEEVKAPKRLPAAVGRVLRAYADPEGEDAEEVDTAQRFLFSKDMGNFDCTARCKLFSGDCCTYRPQYLSVFHFQLFWQRKQQFMNVFFTGPVFQ